MEELNPSEISQVIKQKIDALDTASTPSNEGTIVFLADGIARIHGLGEVMNGELIEFDHGIMGMALNLEVDSVCLLYTSPSPRDRTRSRMPSSA